MQEQFNEMDAFELGARAAGRATSEGDGVLTNERDRRALVNRAASAESRAQLKLLSDERDGLRVFLHNVVPSATGGAYRRVYFLAVALILSLTGLLLAHLAFSPFGFSERYIWAFSVGLPLVCAFLMDSFLERCGSVAVVRTLIGIALIGSLAGMVILSLVRGDVLIIVVKSSLGDTGAGASTTGQSEAASFYEAASRELRIFFGLMAFAIEVATGLAVWEARRSCSSAEGSARRRVSAIEAEMSQLVGRITFLESESEIFAHQFRRDYFHGMIRAVQHHEARRLWQFVVATGIAFLLAGQARAQTHVVEVIDLSRSSDGDEYARNLRAASGIVFKVPPATRIDIIGITDKSFSKPVVLFSGKLPADAGPLQFFSQVAAARSRFAMQIEQAGHAVEPMAPVTDIFGSVLVAQDIFQHAHSTTQWLLFLSDMRQSAPPLDIETAATVPTRKALQTAERNHVIATLPGVNVYVLGAHAEGKNIAYWQSLQEFWTGYFSKSGATLRGFSVMRDIPELSAVPEQHR